MSHQTNYHNHKEIYTYTPLQFKLHMYLLAYPLKHYIDVLLDVYSVSWSAIHSIVHNTSLYHLLTQAQHSIHLLNWFNI